MSRIDDDRRILEAATKGEWYSYREHPCTACGIYAKRPGDPGNSDKSISDWHGRDEDAAFAANARNRMHLYLALAEAVRGLKAPSANTFVAAVHEEQLDRMKLVQAALADLEAPDAPKEVCNAHD